MSYSMYDKERVYLAYRALFSGENAQLRKEKNVKKLVEHYKRGYEAFIKGLGGVGKVVAILKPLLKAGVFGSEAKAKNVFPSLFSTSAEQDKRHSMAEASTAKLESEALVNVERMDQVNQEYQGESVNGMDATLDDTHVGSTSWPENVTVHQNGKLVIKSLYPSYVPFRTQHLVLTSAQRLLEECCFDFTAKWAPSLIDQYRWDCPEAIELNKWTQIILKHVAMFPEKATNRMDGSGIREVLMSVHVLRHSAVHRLHTSTKGINQMIQSATAFAYALRDADRQSQLEELYSEMESKITAQELNKNFLEEKIASEFDEIREAREELDRKEQEAINTLFREDNENKSLVGSMLEESVRGIFNLPGCSNGVSGKHDESPGEAGIDDFSKIEARGDNNPNIAEKPPEAEGSVRPGEPFSPLPEEPILEQEPIDGAEFEPIAEPSRVEVSATDRETWPVPKQPEMDELPVLAGESAQVEEPVREEEVVSEKESIPETGTITMAEAAEEPMADPEPMVVPEPVGIVEPIPDEPDPEGKPMEVYQRIEELELHANSGNDFNEVRQENRELEQVTGPEIDVANDDIKILLRKLTYPAFAGRRVPISSEKKKRRISDREVIHLQEKLAKVIFEDLADNALGMYDLIKERLNINFQDIPEQPCA